MLVTLLLVAAVQTYVQQLGLTPVLHAALIASFMSRPIHQDLAEFIPSLKMMWITTLLAVLKQLLMTHAPQIVVLIQRTT